MIDNFESANRKCKRLVETGKDPNLSTTDQEELGRGKRKRKEKNSKSNSSHLEDTADSESEDSSRTFKRPIIPTPPPSLQICQPGTH